MDNKDFNPNLERPEVFLGEKQETISAEREAEKIQETKREFLSEDEKRLMREELERQIAKVEPTKEHKIQAEDIRDLENDKKLERLLQIAKEKDVFFAIGVAKSTGDPFILDSLHDALIDFNGK